MVENYTKDNNNKNDKKIPYLEKTTKNNLKKSTYGKNFFPLLVPADDFVKSKQPFKSKELLNTYFQRIHNSKEDFLEQAENFKHLDYDHAEYVPFSQYYPTYQDMSENQKKWYFYWRSEARKGNFLKTDLSYIYLHVFELINLISIETNPELIFGELEKIWQNYRKDFVKLDTILIHWLMDFIIVYELPMNPLVWFYNILDYDIDIQSWDREICLEVIVKQSSKLEKLPMKLLYQISNYSPEKNKFYRENRSLVDLDALFAIGIRDLNFYFMKNKKYSFFEHYKTNLPITVKRFPFTGAISKFNEEIEIVSINHRITYTLRRDLGLILKFCENILRKKAKFRSKLQLAEQIPNDWQNILNNSYKDIIVDSITSERKRKSRRKEVKYSEKITPIPEISIDFSSVKELRNESEKIRERLIIENNEASSSSILPSQGKNKTRSEISLLLGDNNTMITRVLSLFKNNNWKFSQNEFALQELSLNKQFFYSINKKSIQLLGDVLIYSKGSEYIVSEDFREEIDAVLSESLVGNFLKNENNKLTDNISEDFDDLTRDLINFINQMKNYHWDALFLIYSGFSEVDYEKKINDIARNANITVDQLIDELNELSLDNLSDILIDTTQEPIQIIDENIETIKNLLLWKKKKTNLM